MVSPVKAGLCVLSLVLFVVTLALISNDRAVTRTSDYGRERLDRVHVAFGLTGLVLGIVVAAMGAAFAFVDSIGNMAPAKAAWAILALIALWFIGGAFGIWVHRNEIAHTSMTDRFKADISFFIISSVVWLITIAVVVADPISGGEYKHVDGDSGMASVGLLGFTAVILIIVIALAAANRDGRGGSEKIGEVSIRFRTQAHWAAMALCGACLGFVVCLAGIGLIFTKMWNGAGTGTYVRTAWTFFAALSLWFLGAMCGIWSWWAYRKESWPGYDVHPYTSYFKAEFAFEIIGSILLIVSITVAAALGAQAKDA